MNFNEVDIESTKSKHEETVNLEIASLKRKSKIKGIVIGIIIGTFVTSGMGVTAVTLAAKEIKYTPSNEKFAVTNAKDALDEIYKMYDSGINRNIIKQFLFSYTADWLSTTSGTVVKRTTTYDCTSINNYENFTIDNFGVELNYAKGGNSGNVQSISKSYENGILSVEFTIYSTNGGSQANYDIYLLK